MLHSLRHQLCEILSLVFFAILLLLCFLRRDLKLKKGEDVVYDVSLHAVACQHRFHVSWKSTYCIKINFC